MTPAMETFGNITWEVTGSTGLLSLGPPPENFLKEPAFIPPDLLKKWTSATGLKGIIIHGQGRHFSSGADTRNLFQMIASGNDLEVRMNQGKAVLNYLASLDIPVIAAIQGVCFGGGLEIALACHIRVCAENALFAFPEVSLGIMPGLGGTVMLPGTIRYPEALKMLLSGDMIDAAEALDSGLADRVVPKKELLPYCLSLMGKMTTDRPVEVINAVMKALRNSATLSSEEAMIEETRLFCMLAIKESERRAAEGS
jgi:enoyl-CoA hydratase/carnithine racemase